MATRKQFKEVSRYLHIIASNKNNVFIEIYIGQNLLEFTERFKTDEDCKEYLSELKLKDSFTCVKCGHHGSQIRKDYSRTCNKCSYTETASSNTLFHKVKFGLCKAFFICFEVSTTTYSAVFLSLMGGVVGLLLVLVLSWIVSGAFDFPMSLSMKNIVLGLTVSAIIGFISGFIPSWSASRLDPVEAMRSNF